MKWIKKYELFRESKSYSNKNILSEICISMLLINNEFLDNILDRGLSSRYTTNSQIFLTDLKNLLLAKNRLKLGKFVDGICIEDIEISKINNSFDGIEFDIEKDWKILVNARTTARNIIDKLLPDEKLKSERIRNIFWLGPNKEGDFQEDIVIELNDDKQYSFFLNKNLTLNKTSSFNLFAEELIGDDLDRLFKEDYLPRWDKLTQSWIRILYENANKNIQQQIEKFIDPKRIDTIGYFEYFDIKHSDNRFKHLGEFMKEFNKNILKFHDLLSNIWKNRDICFSDPTRIYKEWMEVKIVILNSKILENLLTTSLKANFSENIEKLDDEFKLASGNVKMKLVKTLVDKMGCLERPLYYLGNNGNVFHIIPSKEFFREFYEDINIKFDYHVNFSVSEEEENNDFKIRVKLEMDDNILMEMFVIVKMSGSEMSGKLSSVHKFILPENFNYLISKKKLGDIEY